MKRKVRRNQARVLGAGLALGAVAVAGAARAQDATAPPASADAEHLLFSYEASLGCPSEEEFRLSIRERSPRTRILPGRRLYITLEDGPRGTRGTLDLRDTRAGSTRRDVEGRDCHDAARALALIAALILEEEEAAVPAEQGPPPKPDAPSKAQVPTAPTPTPTESHSPVWVTRVFAGILGLGGSAPGPLLAGMAGLELHRDSGGFLSPRFRFAALWTEERSFTSERGSAVFQHVGAVLEACPLDLLGPTTRLTAHLCAAAEGGALIARGGGVDDAASHTTGLFALGGSVLVGTRLGGAFHLDLRGSLLTPLRRDRFFLDGQLFHEIPDVTFRAGAELGVDLDF